MKIVNERSRPLAVGEGELLVIRLWRWDEDRLSQDALADFEIKAALGAVLTDYSVSVFGLRRETGEEIPELIDRLVNHVRRFRNAKHYCLVTEGELAAAGFRVRRQEPPPHHYDIPIGSQLDPRAIKALARCFGLDEKIRMSA